MTMSRNFKIAAVFLCTFVLFMVTLAGCGGSPTSSSQVSKAANPEPAAAAPQKPFSLSLLIPLYQPEPPDPEGQVMKMIKEHTQTNVAITWIPSVNYEDRLNVTLSSNNLPDAAVVLNNKSPNIVQAVKSGMFWETGPYLKDFKNLSRINEIVQYNTAYDGKTYGLYRGRFMARNGFIVRQDWLENLGLKPPEKLDELYEVLKAFTLKDPDKDGKNNTFGLTEYNTLGSFNVFVTMLGGPNGWDVQDGKFNPAHMTKEYVEALNFYRKLYAENLINSDFAVGNKTTNEDNFNKGKAGMFYSAMDDSYSKTANLFKLFPNAKIDVFNKLQGPKGIRIVPNEGWLGMFFFTKNKIKTEEDLKKALAFFDKMDDKAMQDLAEYGVEGKHYEIKNGVVQPFADQTNSYLKDVRTFNQVPLYFAENRSPVQSIPLVQKYTQMWKDNMPYVVANPSAPLISTTYSEIGNDLDKIIKDATTKYIMGSLDEKGWQDAVKQWQSRGGDKVIAEYNQEYVKIKKK